MIEQSSDVILDAALDRLSRWEKLTPELIEQIKKDTSLVVKMGLRDPVRPFIKGEMHPSRKLTTPRLIMAISIVDQLVERFLFSDFATNEKIHYPNGGNMVGFGRSLPHDVAVTQKVRNISSRTGLGPTASDVSGWERRVAPDMLEDIPEVMASMCVTEHSKWLHLARVWALLAARPTYVVGDKIYITQNLGMMPSGTYLTSYGNGIMRMMFAFAAGAEDVMVLGDDCLEWNSDPASAMQSYNSWGLVTRDTETFPTHGKIFTFCSKFYDSTIEDEPLVKPLSWPKMVAAFANNKSRTPAHLSALYQELNGLPGPLYKSIMEWANGVSFVLPPGVEQNDQGESQADGPKTA